MADARYSAGSEGFLDGTISYITPTIKISLVRGYTFAAAHKFVSDVTTAGGVLVSTQTLATKTATDGVADAADTTFATVATGAACGSLLVYQASAVGGGADVATSAQRLICYIDSYSGLPVTPNGGNIAVAYDNGTNRIFRL
jgi:hypothetical protein